MKRRQSESLKGHTLKQSKNPNTENNTKLRYEFSGYASWFANSQLAQRALESEAGFVQWVKPYARHFEHAEMLIGDFLVESEDHPIEAYAHINHKAYCLIVLDQFLEDSVFEFRNGLAQSTLEQLQLLEAFYTIDLWSHTHRAQVDWMLTHFESAQQVLSDLDVTYFPLHRDRDNELRRRCEDRAHQQRCLRLADQLRSHDRQLQGTNIFYNNHCHFFEGLLTNKYDGRLADYIESCSDLKSLIFRLATEQDSQRNTYEFLQAFSDWRLPMLVWLHNNSGNQSVKNALSLLNWLNANKPFLAGCIQGDAQIVEWLDSDAKSKQTLREFTHRCAELSVGLMDVRKLAYTLDLLDHNGLYCDTLLSCQFADLTEGQAQTYQSTFPNALIAISQGITGVRFDQSGPLSVHPDVLLALSFVHPQNTAIVDFYHYAMPALVKLIEQFEAYKAQKSSLNLTEILANSLTGVMGGGKSLVQAHQHQIEALQVERENIPVQKTVDPEDVSTALPTGIHVKL